MKTERPTAAIAAPKHWMDAYGIKYEERLTVTKAQLELKMRPQYSLKTRIWAYLILHTAGYQGEHAQMMKNGHKVSVQPPDIADELQRTAAAYYRSAGVLLDKAALNKLRPIATDMRRALAAMEEDGICERRYNGVALAEMSLKERQARLNGKIELHVWLKPRKPNPDNVKKEWDAQVSEVPPPEFKLEQITKYLHSVNGKVSLFLRHLKTDQQEVISSAWNEFAQAVNKCLPEARIDCLPKADAQCPPSNKEEIVEEKSVKQQPHPHPPQQPEEGRMMMEFPLTLQCLRERDPAVKEAFARRLYSDTVAYCRKHPQFDIADLAKITDHALAAMCKESFRTGPKNHGTGLLLSRVPAIAVTWSLDDEENRPTQRTA